MTSPTPSEPLTGQKLYHDAPVSPATAAKVVATAIGTIYAVQLVLVQVGVLDLVASSASDLAVLAGVLWWSRRRGVTLRDLGVRGVPGRFVVAAMLLGISMWYVTAWLVAIVKPPGDPSKLQQLVEQTPLVPTLIALCVLPALAEEVVFRGVLARALVPRFRVVVAVAISAATFGLYHLFPPQVVSTFALGLVLGLLAVKSRSILPAIVVHLLNNTIAVVLARDEIPGLGTWINDNPTIALPAALALASGGIALSRKGAA